MKARSTLISAVPAALSLSLSLLLAACGGGGSEGDSVPHELNQGTVTGPNSFLMFPNPQMLADLTFETNSLAFSNAYYAAIDPNNDKDTLPKWKVANGFDTAAGPLGQVSVMFGDTRDLGYGRRMTARQNTDGSIAFFVDNYSVTAGSGYTYTPLNLEAGVVENKEWHVGTNAIEYSPGPLGGAPFVKFYTFDPYPPYARRSAANLDGRGLKATPTICISCHGGRGDMLTPSTGSPTSAQLFTLVRNSISTARGDVQARLQMMKVDTFDFSTATGYTRADQEANLKTINTMVLCSFPKQGGEPDPTGCTRPLASAAPNEWQGTSSAAATLKAAYGGETLPNATYSDTYVPTGWSSVGQTTLYNNVVKEACMTCHGLRGTGNQDDLDFDTYAKFQGYASRIKYHVFDRGNMPLAKIVAERFWSNFSQYSTLAAWLNGQGETVYNGSAVLQPGRPIADPGPDRTLRFGPTTLSASNSLFATGYSWSITTNPGSAGSLTSATTATPTFTATANGTYVLQLIVSNGATQSTPATLTLYVNNALTPDPAAIRFSDIKTELQTGVGGCTTCHDHTRATTTAATPPLAYTSYDRNGDAVTNATDDLWFYTEVRGRINFTNIAGSALLRKPSGNHHNGLLRPGFDTSLTPGAAGRASYDLMLNWILNGAPQ